MQFLSEPFTDKLAAFPLTIKLQIRIMNLNVLNGGL